MARPVDRSLAYTPDSYVDFFKKRAINRISIALDIHSLDPNYKPRGENTNRLIPFYTPRCWKLRFFKGTYPNGDKFPYHNLLDCDRICTTMESSIMLSVPVKRPNPLVGAIILHAVRNCVFCRIKRADSDQVTE